MGLGFEACAAPPRHPHVRGPQPRRGPGRRGPPGAHPREAGGSARAGGDAGRYEQGVAAPLGARVPLGHAGDADGDLSGRSDRVTPLPRKVAVIGAGDIGCGWASLCAAAGWPVAIFDANASGLERAATDVPRRARALVALGHATQGIVERGLLELQQGRSLLHAVQDADWVIEAINEDLVAKQRLFHAIEEVAGPEALVTSSSSGIPPTELFARCRRQDRCLVAHPLNPPQLIPLVELVPGAQTTPAMVARAHDYLRALGRMPIVLKKPVPGYVVGRIAAAVWRECLDPLPTGAVAGGDLPPAPSPGPAPGLAAAGPPPTPPPPPG